MSGLGKLAGPRAGCSGGGERVRLVPRFAGGVCEAIVLSRGAVRHQRLEGSARALCAAPSPTPRRGPAPAFPRRPPPTPCPRPSLKPTRGEGTPGRGDVVFCLQRPLRGVGQQLFLWVIGGTLGRREGKPPVKVTLSARVIAGLELLSPPAYARDPGTSFLAPSVVEA